MTFAFHSVIGPMFHRQPFGVKCTDRSLNILTSEQYLEVILGDLEDLVVINGPIVKIKDVSVITLADSLKGKAYNITLAEHMFSARILPMLFDAMLEISSQIEILSGLPKSVAIKTEASLNKLISYFTL